jgi:uncharacterized integral membrane protein
MRWKLYAAVLLAVVVVLFTAQNVQVVEVRFLFWRLEMSRVLLLLGVFGAGALAGWLAHHRRDH